MAGRASKAGRLKSDVTQNSGPCYRSQLLLPQTAEHYSFPCEETYSIRSDLTDTPVAPPLGELDAKRPERAILFYHFLSQNSKTFEKALDFMKLK